MTGVYPHFLTPLASSVKWENEITYEALSESYSLFVTMVGYERIKTKVTVKEAKDPTNAVIEKLQYEYLVLPFSADRSSYAGEKFLDTYYKALKSLWDLNVSNKKFMELVESPVKFEPPKFANGQKVSFTDAINILHFDTNGFYKIPLRETLAVSGDQRVVSSPNMMTSYSKELGSSKEKRVASQQVFDFLKTKSVKTRYWGTTEEHYLKAGFLAAVIIFFYSWVTMFSSVTSSIEEYPSNGVMTVIVFLAITVFASLFALMGGVITGMFIGGISFLSHKIFKRYLPGFEIDQNYTHVYIKLTPYGEELLEQTKAWVHYLKNNPDASYSSESPREAISLPALKLKTKLENYFSRKRIVRF